MFKIIDTDTSEKIARFATEEYARAGGVSFSKDYHRPITVVIESTGKPIAKYIDGEEITVTATIHHLPRRQSV
jgi:hypothetical protein